MNKTKTKLEQERRLMEICEERSVRFEHMEKLLESARTKKLFKKKNYHQQTITDIIQNTIQ